jgi:hypothetical protein
VSDKPKNVTFTLPVELVEKFKLYAKSKYIPSVNAGVREALEQYSIKMEKELLKDEMLHASKDPLFMKDVKDTMEAFEASDDEEEEGHKEW